MPKVNRFVLRNTAKMEVSLLDYGARVSAIRFPVGGQPKEMTLGYALAKDYLYDPFYLGATIGRVSNRIAHGKFTLNGKQYEVNQNDGDHCLHGGERGFSSQHWQLASQDVVANKMTFYYVSQDGEQGFPGEMQTWVSYQLTDENQLVIEFEAQAQQDTPVSLCNHCYFHLGEQHLDGLDLQLNSRMFLPTDHTAIPLGKLQSIDNSDFCFRDKRNIAEVLNQASALDIAQANNGFDHSYLLQVTGLTNFKEPAAVLTGRTTGVSMSVFTDQPALQLYSGQYLATPFQPFQGVCLEAQGIPNAINSSDIEIRNSAMLSKRQKYKATVIYQFSC